MNEQTVVEKKRTGPPRGAGGAKKMRRFTPDERLKAVRLYLEEGFSRKLVCQEMGASDCSLDKWLQAYRLAGEAGLQDRPSGPRQPKLPVPITEKIVELKQANPTFGI